MKAERKIVNAARLIMDAPGGVVNAARGGGAAGWASGYRRGGWFENIS